MPHIVVEYSASCEIDEVIVAVQAQLFDAAFATGLFSKDAIKVRASAYNHFHLPDDKKHFIHVNNKILSGRTNEQKQRLAEASANVLRQFAAANTIITVEVSDLHSESYIKIQN